MPAGILPCPLALASASVKFDAREETDVRRLQRRARHGVHPTVLRALPGNRGPAALISEKLDLPYENPGDGVPAEVVELARVGERIDAVKRYRALTGASLDVAHDVVSKL
jgi:hypothetical protein